MTRSAVPLKHLASAPVVNGLGLSGENDDPDWPRYIRTTDIQGPRALRTDTFASQPPEIAVAASARRGDILMTAAGATIGKSTQIMDDIDACYAGFLVRFRPNAKLVDGRYVGYWMQSSDYWAQIEVGAVRSTIDNFSAGKYQNLVVPVPPLEDQRRIADFLDDQVTRIESATAARNRQLVALDTAIIAAAHAGVTGEGVSTTRETNIPWASTIPDHWGSPRLNQVARMGTGHTPSRNEPEYWLDCHIPWLTTGDVHRFRHDEIDSINDAVLHISDLGLANSAAVLHPRGTVALSRTASAGFAILMDADMATSQDFATWTCGEHLHNYFLLWCLRAMRRDLMKRLAMGSTHKTIYFPDLMSIKIPLPPFEEQVAIARSIAADATAIRAAMQATTKAIDLLSEYKRSLITAAVTGEFDVATASGRGIPV